MPGFGRLAQPDARDADFPMRALLEAAPPPARTSRSWWANGWWGDQGSTSMCVAYAWTHWLEDGPTTQKGPAPVVQPPALYHQAQLVDEWPGEGYDGTSVRAGAKVLQSQGLISSYHWAATLDDIVNAVLTVGPVVMGTNWYSGMMAPDETGLIVPSGPVIGGHAYVIDGVNIKTRLARVKNSWGRHWGRKGFAYLDLASVAKLLAEDGEACLAVEVTKG